MEAFQQQDPSTCWFTVSPSVHYFYDEWAEFSGAPSSEMAREEPQLADLDFDFSVADTDVHLALCSDK